MEQYYYPKTIKGITVALLDMFNDIVVKKYDVNENVIKQISVPIMFGPVEKAQQDRTEDHYFTVEVSSVSYIPFENISTTATDVYFERQVVEKNVRFYQQLPRMALTLDSITYAPNRVAGANEWRYWIADTLNLSDDILSDYQPAPWDINYTLHIKADKIDYFSQIMENILPYFNPKLFLRMKEFSFLNIERDIPVSIGSVNPEFSDDLDATQRRDINVSINLTVEAYFYRPYTYSKLIKIINTKYWIGDNEVFTHGFSTSALQTSGSLILSGTAPLSSDYITSGTGYNLDYNYNWYKQVHETSAFGFSARP
jgi:hypothetical protein